ncbi:MAG: hypothetical protein K9L59_17875 [Desulfobacterales bacterium]|nr:hypothetical protein [Desulfobacterales bacterium]
MNAGNGKLGVNGFGRIGKLTVWHHVARKHFDLENVPGLDAAMVSSLPAPEIRIPVTQAVIYGWYDNEMGSYVNMLGDRTVTVAEQM